MTNLKTVLVMPDLPPPSRECPNKDTNECEGHWMTMFFKDVSVNEVRPQVSVKLLMIYTELRGND